MQQCVLILMNSPMACVAFSVCWASSRVGDRIRTCGLQQALAEQPVHAILRGLSAWVGQQQGLQDPRVFVYARIRDGSGSV